MQQNPLSVELRGLAHELAALAGHVGEDDWLRISLIRDRMYSMAGQIQGLLVPDTKKRPGSAHVVYLAAPYSDPCPKIRAIRAAVASRCAGWLMRKGFLVLSPLSMGHAINAESPALGSDWETWKSVCMHMLTASDMVTALMIRGAESSRGMAVELEYAHELAMPVKKIRLARNGEGFEFFDEEPGDEA